jgi:hypothetical protein
MFGKTQTNYGPQYVILDFQIPHNRSVEYEPILHHLLNIVQRECPDMATDASRIDIRNNVTFVKVLQRMSKFILETRFVITEWIERICFAQNVDVKPASSRDGNHREVRRESLED